LTLHQFQNVLSIIAIESEVALPVIDGITEIIAKIGEGLTLQKKFSKIQYSKKYCVSAIVNLSPHRRLTTLP